MHIIVKAAITFAYWLVQIQIKTMLLLRGGRYWKFYIMIYWEKIIAIFNFLYIILFSISMILSYVHVIILNKDIPNVDDFYLKLKSKYGTLLGYRFH